MKMKCSEVERLLSGYLGNLQGDAPCGVSSLKAIHIKAIKEHLAECGRCSECFKIMTKVDNLVKLKVKEKPSSEYWENYWPKLENRLIENLSKNIRPVSVFAPRFAFAFNGILVALLILLSGFLYINTQQIKSLQIIQDEMQEQIGRYLFHFGTKATHTEIFYRDADLLRKNSEYFSEITAKSDIQMLDKYDKINHNHLLELSKSSKLKKEGCEI